MTIHRRGRYCSDDEDDERRRRVQYRSQVLTVRRTGAAARRNRDRLCGHTHARAHTNLHTLARVYAQKHTRLQARTKNTQSDTCRDERGASMCVCVCPPHI